MQSMRIAGANYSDIARALDRKPHVIAHRLFRMAIRDAALEEAA